jgi:hypothetical protein
MSSASPMGSVGLPSAKFSVITCSIPITQFALLPGNGWWDLQVGQEGNIFTPLSS